MDIDVAQTEGRIPVTIFKVTGDIDANTYQALEARAREAHAAGTRDLVLDLSGVGYVSSAGIRAINQLFRLLRADRPEESDAAMHAGLRAGTFKSPHLKLVCPQSDVLRVLNLSGTDMFLDIYPDVPAAVASF